MEVNMQVSNQYHNPMQELFNAKQEAQREANKAATEMQNTELTRAKKLEPTDIDKALENTSADNNSRQTYGLLVLELMSDPEYQAFQRATAGMSESDKIIAAQSLYSLTSFYGGKIQEEREEKTLPNPIKAYPSAHNQDFINRYKNAFASQSQIDLSS